MKFLEIIETQLKNITMIPDLERIHVTPGVWRRRLDHGDCRKAQDPASCATGSFQRYDWAEGRWIGDFCLSSAAARYDV